MASKPPPLHVPSGQLSSSFEYKSAMYSKKRLQLLYHLPYCACLCLNRVGFAYYLENT